MSLECTRWAWTVEGLSPTTKLVLLHLADRANSLHNAWPSIQGISLDTGCGRSTVKRALQQLRDRKLIFAIGYGGKTGQAVVYKLAGRWTKSGFLNLEPDSGKWVQSDTPTGSTVDPGGSRESRGWVHSEPRNQPDNQPIDDQQPTARRHWASGGPPEGQRSDSAVFDFETLKKEIRNGTPQKLESDQE